MMRFPILFSAVFLGTGNRSSKIVNGNLFLQQPPRCSKSLSEISKSVIEIFLVEVVMARNTVKLDNVWPLSEENVTKYVYD